MAALGVLRGKGEFDLAQPLEPIPVFTIPPEQNVGPHDGVPVNAFEPGRLIRDWLMAGPFDAGTAEDVLAPLGGPAEARPERGTAVKVGGRQAPFDPIGEGVVKEISITGARFDYVTLPGAEPRSRTYLYSLLEVKRPQGCLIAGSRSLGTEGSRIWINGRAFARETALLLEPGTHRLLVDVRGRVTRPAFEAIDAHFVMAEHKRYEWAMRTWREAREAYERTGEWQEVPLILDMCRHGLRTYLRNRIATARERGEYAVGDLQAPFLAACHVATGESLLPDTPMPWESEPEAERLGDLGNWDVVFLMALVPPRAKAMLAREFDRRFAGDGIERLSCMQLIGALVNYPLEPETPPAEGEGP
jgi:hypothetical protein